MAIRDVWTIGYPMIYASASSTDCIVSLSVFRVCCAGICTILGFEAFKFGTCGGSTVCEVRRVWRSLVRKGSGWWSSEKWSSAVVLIGITWVSKSGVVVFLGRRSKVDIMIFRVGLITRI